MRELLSGKPAASGGMAHGPPGVPCPETHQGKPFPRGRLGARTVLALPRVCCATSGQSPAPSEPQFLHVKSVGLIISGAGSF